MGAETDLAQIRREYTRRSLSKAEVDPDPLKQFNCWMEDAQTAGLAEPTAMTLATVSAAGQPSVRVVLLKGVDEQGFVFFTNYLSGKGSDIAANPRCALLFFWQDLERQVRIQGLASKIDQAESQTYFASRPRGSQLGALVSQQSQPVANRQVLEQGYEELERRYQDTVVPMPASWGGYRIAPATFEFWQGRQSRLHDRLFYQLKDGQWLITRLQP